jgi:hypothetical protein
MLAPQSHFDDNAMEVMMNRKLIALSALALPLVPAGVAIVGSSGATAAGAATATCTVNATLHTFPTAPTAYSAGSAGSVTVAPVNRHTIHVASVSPSAGWKYRVDSATGSSVDVYFRTAGHRTKFEAEITDRGGLLIRVTAC